jgi:hypothetical protein
MIRKSKPTLTSTKKARSRQLAREPSSRKSLAQIYPSLAHGPTPVERRDKLLREAHARGIKPMDDATLDAMAEVWPEDEDLDEFLAWLRKARRTGRYD